MNKVALVTGGAVAIRLAKDGYKVVVLDFCKMGEKTIEKVKEAGSDGIFIRGNVGNTKDIKKAISAAVDNFKRLTCLVNCAARYTKGMAKNIVEISESEWTKTMNINLGGYFKTAKYAIPEMLKCGGGTIINISSNAAFFSMPDFSVYSTSKAAINGLTRSLAVDFAPKIRTNAVCPGFVRIANSENNRGPKELKKWYKEIADEYPMKRVCEVEEIANVVAFLASDESSYINGTTITVDGGHSS